MYISRDESEKGLLYLYTLRPVSLSSLDMLAVAVFDFLVVVAFYIYTLFLLKLSYY